MIFVLDNYDSFTWNIVHYLRELGAQVRVERNDALTAAEALATGAAGFLISAGPGRPEAAGTSLALVAACAEARRPLLGICLGHQAVALHFGGRVVRAGTVMHGKTSAVNHDGTGLFEGLASPVTAARYHSLAVAPDSVPACLEVNAVADDGTVQGLRHKGLPIHAVQFHPESIASRNGHRLLANFTGIAACSTAA
ncbi:MAG TPA: aminodeoxychorismate/anthranilate synthase component II [Allosphingosinicella sp.]|nr:aminodeoxychorismate/anthranilate synthase component II [Allosphingosinicella sp.]